MADRDRLSELGWQVERRSRLVQDARAELLTAAEQLAAAPAEAQSD